jgi:hypothetical protein
MSKAPVRMRLVDLVDAVTLRVNPNIDFGVQIVPGETLVCHVYGINTYPGPGSRERTLDPAVCLAYAETLVGPGDVITVVPHDDWSTIREEFYGTVTLAGGGDFAGGMLAAGKAVENYAT